MIFSPEIFSRKLCGDRIVFSLLRRFGEDASNQLLIFYLFLGFSGFLLLILLISTLCVTLAQDDQIRLADDDEEEEMKNNIDELVDISGVAEREIKIVRQK